MGVRTQLHTAARRIAALDGRSLMHAAGRHAAERMMGIVVPLTPVEDGGLQTGWNAGAPAEIVGGVRVEIKNDAQYASFVEEGHRQTPERFVPTIGRTLVDDYVPGRFFLRAAETEYKAGRDTALERMLEKRLRQVMTGDK